MKKLLLAITVGLTVSAAYAASVWSGYLNGTVSAGGCTTVAWFEYGTNTSYGTVTPVQIIPSSAVNTPVSQYLTGLPCCSVYHFRLVCSNQVGVTYGSDNSFIYVPLPTATTLGSTNISASGATINGYAKTE